MTSPMFQFTRAIKQSPGDSIWQFKEKEKDKEENLKFTMMDTFIPSNSYNIYSPLNNYTPTFENLYSQIYSKKEPPKKEPDKKVEEKAQEVKSSNPTKTTAPPKRKTKTKTKTTTYTYTESNYSGTKTKYDKLIEKYAKKYNVDADLVRAMMKQESRFNPTAKSHVGAVGLMQLMPGTARDMGLIVNENTDERYNVEKNIEAGVKYIATYILPQLKKRNLDGDIELVIAAYNAGAGRVKDGKIPQNGETPKYVENVMKYYEEYQAIA